MKYYICSICSFIYDPEAGYPDNEILPGTPFENIPDDWVCPECGSDKTVFQDVTEDE
ncbi:rubredoxin [bacterium]|nr:rubredoxin [bacterium]